MTAGKVQPQLKAGAKKVVFSTLAKEDSRIVVLGVNQETYDFSVQTRRKLATKAGNAAGLVRGFFGTVVPDGRCAEGGKAGQEGRRPS